MLITPYHPLLTIVSDVLQNQRKIHHGNWVFPEAVVDIYCGDTHPTIKDICRSGPSAIKYAVSFTQRGIFYNSYNIILCPPFFSQTSLDSILNAMAHGKLAVSAENYRLSWAHIIYHELAHLGPVISYPQVWDVVYNACLVQKLANQNGCSRDPVLWNPPGWDPSRGQPHSLINADSWAYFASGVFFQKALQLKEPGGAINNCGIYSAQNFANFSFALTGPEGVLLPTVDRTDGTFDAKVPPDPTPEETPPDDPPTPAVPYVLSDLLSDIATPFNAEAYFATYTPSPVSNPSATPPAPTATESAPFAEGVCSFHMTYWRLRVWPDGSNPYNIEIRILDDKKTTIGWLPHTKDVNKYSWNVVSRLEDTLAVTPQARNDYVQFTIGDQSWSTNQASDHAHIPNCSVGDWDCSDLLCVSIFVLRLHHLLLC